MISEQQIEALEAVHGPDMVVVLTVGDEEFAFRRPSAADVDFMLDAKERGNTSFIENACTSCALCPDEPGAEVGTSPALAAVKAKLAALFVANPYLKDTIPIAWASECGWYAIITPELIGPGLYRVACGPKPSEQTDQTACGCSMWSASIQVRKLTVAQYDKLRKLDLQGGNEAERQAWKDAATGDNKAEIERLYPFLPVSIGTIIRTLGDKPTAVSVKKRHAGSAPAQSPSSEKPSDPTT